MHNHIWQIIANGASQKHLRNKFRFFRIGYIVLPHIPVTPTVNVKESIIQRYDYIGNHATHFGGSSAAGIDQFFGYIDHFLDIELIGIRFLLEVEDLCVQCTSNESIGTLRIV